MQRLLLDFNPLTGTREYMHVENETIRIVQEQDVTPVLEFAKALRNDDYFSAKQMQSENAHYARIPWEIEREMKAKHNVWWEDKNDHGHKKFFSVLNRHYPHFKTTAWNHE